MLIFYLKIERLGISEVSSFTEKVFLFPQLPESLTEIRQRDSYVDEWIVVDSFLRFRRSLTKIMHLTSSVLWMVH